MPTALITGVTGQDGMYLAEYLLGLGYSVYGLIRGQNNPKRERLEELFPALELVEGDLLDQSSLIAALEYTQPDEVYNLAAISFVALSWKQALLTGEPPRVRLPAIAGYGCGVQRRPSARRPRHS